MDMCFIFSQGVYCGSWQIQDLFDMYIQIQFHNLMFNLPSRSNFNLPRNLLNVVE